MFCANCGLRLETRFCSNCGAPSQNSASEPAKKKNSFWKRLGNAIAWQAAIEAQRMQPQQQRGVYQNSDGSWSYRNEYLGISAISDGEHIDFTK
jgi:hypothetical protein